MTRFVESLPKFFDNARLHPSLLTVAEIGMALARHEILVVVCK
jgi:hypothetical protein